MKNNASDKTVVKTTHHSFEKSYKNLNSAQKQAVDSIDGPVMVVAGPGTGKTTLLTLRIANILRQTDIGPENILALTFTNSGVYAMRQKLLEYIGDSAYRVNIFTFHSFAEYIIKEFSFYFKELEFAKVINDLDKVKILEEIILNNKFTEIVSDYDQFSQLKQVISAIDNIKKEGLSPEQFATRIPNWEKEMLSDDEIFYKRKTGKYNVGDIKPSEKEKIDKRVKKAHEIYSVFEQYQNKLKENGFYDFHDMILSVLSELERNENLKLDLQEKYQYLLVDEHQDTNDGQNRLIELLTDAEHLDGHPNLFTVGDEKQSIYRFQGASEQTFKHFHSIYKDVLVINLEENYRSTRDILSAAHNLITHSLADAVNLNSNTKTSSPIKIAQFSNYKFELLYLVMDIQKKIESGVDPSEIAVIYRSNKHAIDLKEVFSHNKIPHTILSKDNILTDINISNIITLLRFVNDPTNNFLLSRSLLINFLNFDSYQVLKVLREFDRENRQENIILFEYLNDEKLPGFEKFAKKICDIKNESSNKNFSDFFKLFLDEIGYLKYMLLSDDGQDQIIKIDKLFDEIKRQIESNHKYSIADFLKFIDSYEKYNLDIETGDPEIIGGVNLMTAHKSKGLEFEHVYIFNTTRKNWEDSRGFTKISLPIDDYKGDINDERRLFYVAITRAKKDLCITSSLTDWEGKEKDKSQFISEIGDSVIENIETTNFEQQNINKISTFIEKKIDKKSIFDTEYLKNLFLNSNLSVTALNNYLECPNKYLFRSLLKMPSEYVVEFVFGDLVHKSLERFFNDSKREEKILPKEVLLENFKNNIKNSNLVGTDYNKYLEKGIKILSEYYDEYSKKWITDVATERHIQREFQIDDKNTINLSGIIDKIEFLDGGNSGKVNIIDYKTGKTYYEKTTKSQKQDLERQLIFYHILFENYDNGKVFINKSYLDFLEKNSDGEFAPYEIHVDESQKNELKDIIKKMAAEILSGEFLKKGCDKKDCEFCKLRKEIK